jgi:hypothetical protein
MAGEVKEGIFWALSLYGVLAAFALSGILILTFLRAYFSPDQAILITVNQYGEANIEFWLIVFTMVCWVVMLAGSISMVIKKRRNHR